MKTLLTVLAALVCASAAFAAFQVYDSTVSGRSQANSFDASATHLSKLVLSQTGDASASLSPAGSATIPASLSNPNHSGATDETLSNLSGTTFTTSPDTSCGSHLSVSDPSGSIIGQGVSPGRKIDGTLTVTADSGLPSSCAGGTYVIEFAGTATP